MRTCGHTADLPSSSHYAIQTFVATHLSGKLSVDVTPAAASPAERSEEAPQSGISASIGKHSHLFGIDERTRVKHLRGRVRNRGADFLLVSSIVAASGAGSAAYDDATMGWEKKAPREPLFGCSPQP